MVETKAPGDASELELHIREVNTGRVRVRGRRAEDGARARSAPTTPRASTTCPTCCRSCASTSGRSSRYELPDPTELLQINDRCQLADVTAVAQRQIHERHMLAGVTIVNPDATVIDVEVEIGQDTVIAPFTSLHGATTIGQRLDDRAAARR